MIVIVALYDKVADLFMQPMFVKSVGVAYRSLQDEAARGGENNQLAAHPKDFQLFKVGSYDDHTGVITALKAPELLVEIEALVDKGE